MFKISLIPTLVLFLLSSVSVLGQTNLYPAIEPHETGFLIVSEIHTIYWEESGNPNGVPVIALHGGPGGSSGRSIRRLFDPQQYRIIQFDQRGAGQSTPFAEWRDNNTTVLVEDINALSEALQIDGQFVLFGLSWGTTLALAYSQRYPEKVRGLILWGVFTCQQSEIDHLYHGGVKKFYPENFYALQQVIPNPEKNNYPLQLFSVVTGTDRREAANASTVFSTYESWMESIGVKYKDAFEDSKDQKSMSLAILENYYMSQGCFLEEGQLIKNIGLIKHIPAVIVNGRLDMLTPPITAYHLAKEFTNGRLSIVEDSGHVDLSGALAVVGGSTWLLSQF